MSNLLSNPLRSSIYNICNYHIVGHRFLSLVLSNAGHQARADRVKTPLGSLELRASSREHSPSSSRSFAPVLDPRVASRPAPDGRDGRSQTASTEDLANHPRAAWRGERMRGASGWSEAGWSGWVESKIRLPVDHRKWWVQRVQ